MTTFDHNCCSLPRINRHHIHPEIPSKIIQLNENEQRKTVEEYIFVKLEEYAREKSTHLFHLTSFSRIQRRLKREAKYLSKQFQPTIVSEQKILQWIDEILEKIDSSISSLTSSTDLQKSLLTNQIFSTQNLNNQWTQLQFQRANIFFQEHNLSDKELLSLYEEHIVRSLTPNKLENDRLILENKERIDLDLEYNHAEHFAKEYLRKMIDNYRQRQYPNLDLMKRMIQLGMEQMVKRPRIDDLRKSSRSLNFLAKAIFIQMSKNAYSMSLKNVADDFMVKQ